jgi:hypothetical protein
MKARDSDLPDEIQSRIDTADFDKELQQWDVALEFVQGERPFYNVAQMHAALGQEVSDDTVRSRMDELHERDVLSRRKMNNGNIYWLDRDESDWPIPPDVEVEPEREEPTITEWRQKPSVQVAAGSVLLAILGTAVTLIGTFQIGGYYQLPFSASNIIATGLAAGIFSYLGLFVAGLLWIFDIPDIDEGDLNDLL